MDLRCNNIYTRHKIAIDEIGFGLLNYYYYFLWCYIVMSIATNVRTIINLVEKIY